MLPRILVLLLVFVVMGFGDLRGSFLGIARDYFFITSSQGALIPVAGALAFTLFALPSISMLLARDHGAQAREPAST